MVGLARVTKGGRAGRARRKCNSLCLFLSWGDEAKGSFILPTLPFLYPADDRDEKIGAPYWD